MAVPAELARDSSVAGPIGSLALSVVRPHAASMALRALRWHRDLDRLGVRVPLCLVHDLGLLLASSNEQLSLGPRTDGAQVLTQSGEDPRVFDQYSALISDVAASEAAQRSRTLRLSDDIVVVLLARLLGTVAARIP
ncbi:MAG TPA: hypothetical protein PKD61_36500, partial [Polyangiaceae bacterium]|nr:hypothetical protein [Polyangiaceae bacterium]